MVAVKRSDFLEGATGRGGLLLCCRASGSALEEKVEPIVADVSLEMKDATTKQRKEKEARLESFFLDCVGREKEIRKVRSLSMESWDEMIQREGMKDHPSSSPSRWEEMGWMFDVY